MTAGEISKEEAKATSENKAGSKADDHNVYKKTKWQWMAHLSANVRVGHELDISLEGF